MKVELPPKNRAEGGAENIGRRRELNIPADQARRLGGINAFSNMKVMGALDRN